MKRDPTLYTTRNPLDQLKSPQPTKNQKIKHAAALHYAGLTSTKFNDLGMWHLRRVLSGNYRSTPKWLRVLLSA